MVDLKVYVLIGKGSPCGGGGFPRLTHYLSGPLPYNQGRIYIWACMDAAQGPQD